MIDPSLFTVERLLRELIVDRDRPWLVDVEIVPAYMPPNPRPDTRPRCVVRYAFVDQRDGERDDCFLRHSSGPRQRHFWDMYGDDYLTPELALLALFGAPPPPQTMGRYFSHKFRLPLAAVRGGDPP